MMKRWQDITNEKDKYAAYLCSPEWWARRNAVKTRCGGVCEKCGFGKFAHAHHLVYTNKYNEPLTDLLGVCETCHQRIHKPAPEYVPIPATEQIAARLANSQVSLEMAKTPQQRARMVIHYVRWTERQRCKDQRQRFRPLGWKSGMDPMAELQLMVGGESAWRIAEDLFRRFMSDLNTNR